MPERPGELPAAWVIADAGPLIALGRANRLELLQQLFQRVLITTAVAGELQLAERPQATDAQQLQAALAAGWLEIHADAVPAAPLLNPGVDPGEASAISLACQLLGGGGDVLLLIDDRAGRAEARHHGLCVIGTAAVAVLAEEGGLIPSALTLLQDLREAGYYLSDAVLASVNRHHSSQPPPST